MCVCVCVCVSVWVGEVWVCEVWVGVRVWVSVCVGGCGGCGVDL